MRRGVSRAILIALVCQLGLALLFSGRPSGAGAIHAEAPDPLQTVVFQQGLDGYTGCADTRISGENPNSNFGSQELILGMRGLASNLVAFDVSSLPPYAVIVEASFALFVSNYGQRDTDPVIATTYAVTRTWAEMQATWNKATHTSAWGLPGCNDILTDRSPVSMGSQAIFARDTWYEWDVTPAVQAWVLDPSSNHGLLAAQTNVEIGGEYDIRHSEYPGIPFRPRLSVTYFLVPPTSTPTPTVTRTATASPTATNTRASTATRTRTSTPTATSSPTATPTGTATATQVPSSTATSTELPPTATPLPTSTATATEEPTATATITPLPTATETALPTQTPTPVVTPLVLLHRVYLPLITRGYPRACIIWQRTFDEEFIEPRPEYRGWFADLAGGQMEIKDSYVHQWTGPEEEHFPLLWRNDLFYGAENDFMLEVRFRHSGFTPYGTTVALNSQPFTGQRTQPGAPLPPGIEDILSIHHVVDPQGGVQRFDVALLGKRVPWPAVTPGDTNWHTLLLTLEEGGLYTLYADGKEWSWVYSTARPTSIYLGNPTTQLFWGGWTQLYVDYVRISRCIGTGVH